MKCPHCDGAGAVPIVYVDKRKRHVGQLALAAQLCLLCRGSGQRERVKARAMQDGRVVVRQRGAR